jgi:peptide/nickel transport system permease protein
MMPYLLSLIFPGLGHLKEEAKTTGLFFMLATAVHGIIFFVAFRRGMLTGITDHTGKYWFSSSVLYVILLGIWVLASFNLRKLKKREEERYGRGYWSIVGRRFIKDKKGLFGAFILLVVLYSALFSPFFATYDPLKMDLKNTLTPPSREHPFGTDNFGRDILNRLIYGSRVALGVGAVATLLNMMFGGFLGLLGGYYKGPVDAVIMRFLEIINTIPFIILVILIMSVFGAGVVNLIIVLGIFGLGPARIIRSEVLSVRESDYVMASQALGARDLRIIFRHILPNSIASLLVVTTMTIGVNIIVIAGLSFLGYGVKPPTPSWGAMLQQAQDYMRVAWWMAVFPGLAIILTVFGFNILGDSLRDVLDPKLK